VKSGDLQNDGRWVIDEIRRLSREANDPRAANFSEINFELEKHLDYTALADSNGQLITACGLFNGGRYPDGVYRCMNRTFVSPKFRVSHALYPGFATRYILPYQLEKYSSFLQSLFTSREKPKGRYFLKRWARLASEYGDWTVQDDMVQVNPGVESRNSYQAIAVLNSNFGAWAPKRIAPDAWFALS
jgi:hypothetical protein